MAAAAPASPRCVQLQEFDLAVTNAVMLRDMSQTNVFSILKNVDYLASATNFTVAVDGLINAAMSQDLECATEAYTRVARNCVQCHERFRRAQFVRAQEKAIREDKEMILSVERAHRSKFFFSA